LAEPGAGKRAAEKRRELGEVRVAWKVSVPRVGVAGSPMIRRVSVVLVAGVRMRPV
jgi:hypothetical protein